MSKAEISLSPLGAHTSTAGGLHHALLEGQAIGANAIQIFTSNHKRWQGKVPTAETLEQWIAARQQTGICHIMSHDSFLINLGSPDAEGLIKSRAAFAQEIQRCHQLNIDYLNFHPGSALISSEEECLEVIVESLLQCTPLVERGNLKLVLEATAGQGSNVGYRFAHLGYIIEKVHKSIPIGVCIDTCHIFAAGYDIRTRTGWDKTLKEFDREIGLEYLTAIHVNDSVKGLGSHVDRHAYLGQGLIGWECFETLMTDPRLQPLPKYLETPGLRDVWVHEIAKLRTFERTVLP